MVGAALYDLVRAAFLIGRRSTLQLGTRSILDWYAQHLQFGTRRMLYMVGATSLNTGTTRIVQAQESTRLDAPEASSVPVWCPGSLCLVGRTRRSSSMTIASPLIGLSLPVTVPYDPGWHYALGCHLCWLALLGGQTHCRLPRPGIVESCWPIKRLYYISKCQRF